MKQFVLVLLTSALGVGGQAQTWNEEFLNLPANIRYGSNSPTRIAYNAIHDFAVANVEYSSTRGDFHAIDASGRAHSLGAYIGGIRHIGCFDVQGHLSYQNRQDNEQHWNSTLWLMTDNPFILCDSIVGDATSEVFDLRATAAYTFSERLKAGLEIGLRTGNRADQTDPRPRAVTSILPITAGIDYRLTNSWSMAVSGGLRFYSQVVEQTNGSSLYGNSHRIFLMKGMGDYGKRSTGDEPGYKRDYTGSGYQASVSAAWQPGSGTMSDFIEATLTSNHQDANDGGISYSFHGGDYSETISTIHNRLLLKANKSIHHNITIDASLQNGKGAWYDQKRQTDLEHGGLAYYEVLNKSTIHKSKRLTASLGYQLDVLRNDGRRDITVNAQVGMSSLERKQLLGDTTPKQEIQMLNLSLQAGKTLYINKVTLLAQVSGGYQSPQKQTYASGSPYTDSDNIDAVYTCRVFEFESAQSWNIGAYADASLPVGEKLTAGIYAGVRHHAYNGKSEYRHGYDGTHLTTIDAGAYIKF